MDQIAKTMNPKDSDVYRNSTRNRYDPEGVAPQATAFSINIKSPSGLKGRNNGSGGKIKIEMSAKGAAETLKTLSQ